MKGYCDRPCVCSRSAKWCSKSFPNTRWFPHFSSLVTWTNKENILELQTQHCLIRLDNPQDQLSPHCRHHAQQFCAGCVKLKHSLTSLKWTSNPSKLSMSLLEKEEWRTSSWIVSAWNGMIRYTRPTASGEKLGRGRRALSVKSITNLMAKF